MSIPLLGQGNPLPPHLPYDGAWILEPRIFLYLSEDTKPVNPAQQQLVLELNLNDDNWSFGLDARPLAQALSVSVERVFEANRLGELTLEDVLTDEDETQKLYIFALGGNTTTITYSSFAASGRA